MIIRQEKPSDIETITTVTKEAFKDQSFSQQTGPLIADDLRKAGALTISLVTEENYALKVPRPWSDMQDEKERAKYMNTLKGFLKDPSVDVWYLDETGVEADPRPRRRWAKKGEKLKITKNGGHLRMNVTGMVCPRTGVNSSPFSFRHTLPI